MRRRLAVLGLLLTGALTTACAPPFVDACPAIGYVTGLSVDATGIPDAAWVQLCAGDVCSSPPGEPDAENLRIMSSETGGVWAFSFTGIEVPDEVTVLVTDADRTLLQKSEHRIVWTHSTARCGGPSTTPPIVLHP